MRRTIRNKYLLMAVCIILSFSIFSGCTNNKPVSNSQDEQVVLKWVLGGLGELKDSEMVWGEFNKKLQEFIPNTTVSFEVIPYSDFEEKWRLMAASKEEVDLVWVGWMLDIAEEAKKGSLMALDELLADRTDLKEELPDYIFDLTKVDGKPYAIPNYQIMTSLPYGAKTQAELAKKHNLDAEAVTKIFDKQDVITKEDFKVFEDYLEKLKTAGELQKGVSRSFLYSIIGRIGGLGQFRESITANAVIDWRDNDIKVYDLLTDFPEANGYYDLAHDWYQKGYIRKDILSIQDFAADENKENGYVLWSHSVFEGDSERQTKQAGFPILSIPVCQEMYVPHARPSTNTGISKTSKNPERAMQLLELMNTEKGKELYNMLVFGIEGTHYNKISETDIEWLCTEAPGKSTENTYGFDNWVIGNMFNSYETQYDTQGWNDYILNKVNAGATPSPLIGFTLNTDNIKLEIAQYSAIMREYEYVRLGANSNYKELIAERDSKLKKAGSDKIIEEVRKQVEEWKSKYKN